MKKLILMLFFATIHYSCEDSNVSNGRELYKMYFDKMLKDPQSFVVYKEEFKKDGDVKVEWIIEYGAKNGFGGMVRESIEFSTIGDMLFIEGSAFEKKEGELIMVY